MSNLPLRLPWDKAADRWATIISPVIDLPPNQGILLKNQSLMTGSNVINHKLGRKLQGWVITRIKASATVYDTQDNNQTPTLTLQLVASAPAVIDLWVF